MTTDRSTRRETGSIPDDRRWYQRAMPQLVLARLREFFREPEAVFWVYGFPIVMVVGLGIAFRNQPVEKIAVDVVEGPFANYLFSKLSASSRFEAEILSEATARRRLRTGKTQLLIFNSSAETEVRKGEARTNVVLEYRFDPSRPESVLARNAADDALQRAAGRVDLIEVHDDSVTEPGGRYVDFLVPGLLGMSLMGGGLWGVGFVTVDMRIRKLLKRFLATPMRKSEFLASIMISRMIFMIPEVLVLLVFARLVFGVHYYGSMGAMLLLIVLGATMFSGIGLLVASRAKTVEAVSGLMNLVMLPMWMLSGIFFSSDRYPAAFRPLIDALPLTPLIEALRAVMLEGATLGSQGWRLAAMLVWSALSFAAALKIFRWQ